MVVIPAMLKDWKRVLKKDGKVKIIVPEIEACMRNFLNSDETDNDKWSWKIEYIFGRQHKQAGQQLHKSAFTPTHLKKIVVNAGLVISSIDIINNGRNDCIHLTAHKF